MFRWNILLLAIILNSLRKLWALYRLGAITVDCIGAYQWHARWHRATEKLKHRELFFLSKFFIV